MLKLYIFYSICHNSEKSRTFLFILTELVTVNKANIKTYMAY